MAIVSKVVFEKESKGLAREWLCGRRRFAYDARMDEEQAPLPASMWDRAVQVGADATTRTIGTAADVYQHGQRALHDVESVGHAGVNMGRTAWDIASNNAQTARRGVEQGVASAIPRATNAALDAYHWMTD